jgi:hypothetical protein
MRLAERRKKKTLAKLVSKFKKLLANSNFYSHLASWQVVISTPASIYNHYDYHGWVITTAMHLF